MERFPKKPYRQFSPSAVSGSSGSSVAHCKEWLQRVTALPTLPMLEIACDVTECLKGFKPQHPWDLSPDGSSHAKNVFQATVNRTAARAPQNISPYCESSNFETEKSRSDASQLRLRQKHVIPSGRDRRRCHFCQAVNRAAALPRRVSLWMSWAEGRIRLTPAVISPEGSHE